MSVTFDSLAPWQQIDRYADLVVETPSGKLAAPITEYRCLKTFSFGARGCDDAISVKNALIQCHKDVLKAFGGGPNIMDVFTGKASPDLMAKGLGIVFAYRKPFVEKNIKSSDADRRKAAEILMSPTTDVLARFAFAFLGLDCNGFVGNYLKLFPAPAGLGPQHTPGQWYKYIPDGNFRKKVEDFEIGDVVISSNFQHIGLIDEFSMYNQIDIAQSGGKIMFSSHKFSKDKWKDRAQLFTMSNPTGGFGGCPTVFVARAVSKTAHGHIPALVTKP